MSQSYHKIWIHLVWTTHCRKPLLSKKLINQLRSFIKNVAIENDFHYDLMNGVADHVHCLISIHPKYAISDIVKQIKGESSHWINENKLIADHFKWQDGFGAFSVSERDVTHIRKYIYDQEKHHSEISFDEELINLNKGLSS